jgi:hypothetical protein
MRRVTFVESSFRAQCLGFLCVFVSIIDIFRIYWSPGPCLAFEASADPVDTSAQATLAPQQTTELEESADTTFMGI